MMLAALMGKQPSQADQIARSKGFPSAAAMAAWQAHEMQRITSNSAPGTASSSAPVTGNDTAETSLFIHPAVLFRHILDKWNQATGGQ